MITTALIIALAATRTLAFSPPIQQLLHGTRSRPRNGISCDAETCLTTLTGRMMLPHAHDELASWLISSGDTAANIQSIAGKFFQVSLLPYLVFLYFLTYKGNRTPATASFGFQYLLVFVAAGIFGGVLTESTYGCILANADWIHGGSEALLTLSNVLIVSLCFCAKRDESLSF